MGSEEDRDRPGSRVGIYVEDALILLALVPLFVITVFFRQTAWGKAALLVVLVGMAVIFVLRFRRVHRAFKGRD